MIKVGYNFNLINPEHFINRYLYILGYNSVHQIKKSAIEMVTLHYIDETMQKYPISKIAAVSVILAINCHHLKHHFLDQTKQSNKSWFEKSKIKSDNFFKEVKGAKLKQEHQFYLNTDIWNTERVYRVTGYAI